MSTTRPHDHNLSSRQNCQSRRRRWLAAFPRVSPLTGGQSVAVVHSVVDFCKGLFGSGRRNKRSNRRLISHRHARIETLESRALLAAVTWDGGGLTDNWSDALNWSDDNIPDAAADITFDATSVKNSVIDPVFTASGGSIRSLNIDTAYTGQVSLGAETLSVSSGFTIDTASSFDAGTGLVRFTGNHSVNSAASLHDLEIDTGAFGVTLLQDLNISNAFTITTTDYFQTSGGSRNFNVGGNVISNDASFANINVVVSFVGTGHQTITGSGELASVNINKAAGNVQLPADFVFHNGTLTGSGLIENTGGKLVLGDGSQNYTLDFAGTIDDLEVNVGASGINLQQDANVTNTFTIATTDFLQGLGGSRNINVSGNVVSNDDNFGSPNAVVNFVGTGNQTITGSGELVNVNINKPAGNVQLPADFVFDNGTLTGSGLIENTGGKLVLGDGSQNYTLDFAGTINDLEVNVGASGIVLAQDTNVTNTFTITTTDFILGAGDFKVSGDVTSVDPGYGGTAFVSLVGATDQSLLGTGEIHNLNISKSSGDVLMSTFNLNYNQVTVSTGEWDVLGNTVAATSGFTAQVGKITGAGTLNGNVTVNSGGTLGGTVTVNGTVTTNSGGTVALGNSPGIVNTGSVSFTSGSTFDVEIGGTTPGNGAGFHDQLNVTGTVALGGATLVTSSFGGFVPTDGDTFVIINNDGGDAVSGTFAGLAEGATITNFLGNGIDATISYVGGDGNDVVLESAAPPPQTLTWVGDVDSNWNTGTSGVDTNWDTDTLPQDGDTLIFPGFVGNRTLTNDTTAGNSYILQVGPGNRLQGNSITLDLPGADVTNVVGTGNNPRLSMPITLASDTTWTTTTPAPTFDIVGVLSGGSLTTSGNGLKSLQGANTYTGTTTIGGGNVTIKNASALGSAATGTTLLGTAILVVETSGTINEPLTVGSGGRLQFNAGAGGQVNWAGAIDMVGGATIIANNLQGLNDATVSGQITGTSPLTLNVTRKPGLALSSAANNYTGGTAISGTATSGPVIVSGSTPEASAVTVSNNGKLGGTGTVGGSTTVNSGGSIRPGAAVVSGVDVGSSLPGILNTASVSFVSGAMFDVQFGGTAPGNSATNHDQLNVTG